MFHNFLSPLPCLVERGDILRTLVESGHPHDEYKVEGLT